MVNLPTRNTEVCWRSIDKDNKKPKKVQSWPLGKRDWPLVNESDLEISESVKSPENGISWKTLGGSSKKPESWKVYFRSNSKPKLPRISNAQKLNLSTKQKNRSLFNRKQKWFARSSELFWFRMPMFSSWMKIAKSNFNQCCFLSLGLQERYEDNANEVVICIALVAWRRLLLFMFENVFDYVWHWEYFFLSLLCALTSEVSENVHSANIDCCVFSVGNTAHYAVENAWWFEIVLECE